MTLSRQAIFAYCASVTAFSLISHAFNFYYVKIFMNFYNIDQKWFQVAQVLYMIWNAVNDPLFAYIQDGTNLAFTKTRRESIMYSGPLFALSFLIPWIPWGNGGWIVGLHLIVALFIWDTMFTFVGLAVCALFSELSQDSNDRIALTRYAQVGGLIGSCSVMFLEFASNSIGNFRHFQIATAIVALCSWLLFRYTGRNAHTQYDLLKMNNPDVKDGNISHEKNMDESYCKQTCQILSDTNFLSFVVTNFCQEFHRTFLSNFMAIICDQLVSADDISIEVRKTFYGGTSMASALLVIAGAPMISKFSYFHVIRSSYIYTVIAGCTMYMYGQGHPWLLMLFMLLDTCVSNASFSLFNMPLADIADDNMFKYNRNLMLMMSVLGFIDLIRAYIGQGSSLRHPISSMVFGTNALIVKPAISLSPMLVAAILNLYGYRDIQSKKGVTGSTELKTAMFTLVCFYPMILGTIQFFSWSFFSIREKSKQIYINA